MHLFHISYYLIIDSPGILFELLGNMIEEYICNFPKKFRVIHDLDMKLVAIPICSDELFNDLMFPICLDAGKDQPLPGIYKRECFMFEASHLQEMIMYSEGDKSPYRSNICIHFICDT